MSKILVKLQGGLGNQMFQYAAGKALAIRLCADLKFDVAHFKSDTLRKYVLDCFLLEEEFATFKEIQKFQKKTLFVKWPSNYTILKEDPLPSFIQEYFSVKGNVYLDGYWQSDRYFKHVEEIILEKFILKNTRSSNYINLINNCNSVSLHIRRGDYFSNSVANKFFHHCDIEFWEEAIKYISKTVVDPFFFIFSDDMKWVSDNFHFKTTNILNVTTNDSLDDFWLMSNCKHNIIANSSFSWWSAFINKNVNKIVVAPKKWFKHTEFPMIYPESWTRI